MKPSRLKAQLDRFKRDEDGAITAYIVATFLLMVLATGMAIDLMRHEVARADVQNALDRAVLAAAALNQTEDRESIVQSYMDTRNFHELGDPYIEISASEQSAKRSYVAARAKYEVPTWFMKLIGITELTAPAASSALQGLSEIEIVLVLDESRSMTSNPNGSDRLGQMKSAATKFVQTVLEGNGGDYTTVSIVPFSSTVIMQDLMRDQYDGSERCFYFRNWEQERLGISQTYDYLSDSQNCTNTVGEYILPYSNDLEELEYFISQMDSIFWTSQHTGMKWGVALLDPSFRDVMRGMVSSIKTSEGTPEDGEDYFVTPNAYISGLPVIEDESGTEYVDLARANQLPRDYGDQDVQKILVIMSDGHNRPHSVSGMDPQSTQQLNLDLLAQCDILHGRTDSAVLDQDGNVQFEAGTKPEGLTVYTIAFDLIESEVEGSGENLNDGYNEYEEAIKLLSDDPVGGCASAGKDFNVTGGDALEAAFSSIAAEITRLKLVN